MHFTSLSGPHRRPSRIVIIILILLLATGCSLSLLATRISAELAITVLTTVLTTAAAVTVQIWRAPGRGNLPRGEQ